MSQTDILLLVGIENNETKASCSTQRWCHSISIQHLHRAKVNVRCRIDMKIMQASKSQWCDKSHNRIDMHPIRLNVAWLCNGMMLSDLQAELLHGKRWVANHRVCKAPLRIVLWSCRSRPETTNSGSLSVQLTVGLVLPSSSLAASEVQLDLSAIVASRM